MNSFLKDDNIKSAIDKLILSRLENLTEDQKKQLNTSESNKQSTQNEQGLDDKEKRKLFLGAVMGGLGDAAGGLGSAAGGLVGGVGDALGGEGGVGVGVGMAAAGAGAMKKQQREMEHRHAMSRVENEMASAQFSADFQDQAIMDLSRAVGRANYVDGRIVTIKKNFDYSMTHLLNNFYDIIY